MSDQDGNVYKTITIGTQTWMAENLRVTKYRNGNLIPNVTDNAAWAALTTGAYCNYTNTTDIDQIATYGALFNWYAATDNRNIAPTGWHLPTDAEWTTLTTTLLGDVVAGGKMKEAGYLHWLSPNTDATNESGFTALPGGSRYSSGTYDNIGDCGYWWSTTEIFSVWARVLSCRGSSVSTSGYNKELGFSVRCVRD
jgi:uncharacterized protein (TIGR02145 family)